MQVKFFTQNSIMKKILGQIVHQNKKNSKNSDDKGNKKQAAKGKKKKTLKGKM